MQNLTTREKFSELGRAVTLIYTNRSIMLSSMVRIINTLSLFGLVLAIGLVVDDAIVVVEAVEHQMEHGLSPRDATICCVSRRDSAANWPHCCAPRMPRAITRR